MHSGISFVGEDVLKLDFSAKHSPRREKIGLTRVHRINVSNRKMALEITCELKSVYASLL